MSSKITNQELEVPGWSGLSWPLWSRFDDVFRDGEWRRPFKIEECHEDDALVIRAELPGVDPDKDVKVEVVDNELVISAEKTESHASDGKHVHRSEIRYGSLTRSVPLPKGFDESSIKATYKDGVLEVRVAMLTEVAGAMTRTIHITRA